MFGVASLRRRALAVALFAFALCGALLALESGATAIDAAPSGPAAIACQWRQLADNVPRSDPILVPLPPIENALLAFGGASGAGLSSPVMSDTWRLSLGVGSQGAWNLVPASGDAPGPRVGHAGALRETTLGFELVTYGGYDGVPVFDLVSDRAGDGAPMGLAAGASPQHPLGVRRETHAQGPMGGWRALDADQATARAGHAALYWAARDWLLSFGGVNWEERVVTSDTLRLALGTEVHTWTELVTAGDGPSARLGHTVIYDEFNDQAVVFGGTPDETVGLADVWLLSLGGDIPTWSAASTTGPAPVGRFDHVAVYLPAAHAMVVFGGTTDGSDELGDLHLLDLSADPPAWSPLVATGSGPGPRKGAAGAAPRDDALVLYGGQAGEQALSDAWLLDCQVPEATEIPSPVPTDTATLPPTATTQPTITPTVGPTSQPPIELPLHGLIYDEAGGRGAPIWGASVRVSPCHTPHQPFVGQSGPDGTYRVVLPGAYYYFGCQVQVEVAASGWQTLQTTFLYDDLVAHPERDFALAAEAPATPTATLEPGSIEMSGLVYDASVGRERPVPEAYVRVPACNGPRAFGGATAWDGRYRVVLPPPYFLPGCAIRVSVTAAGFDESVLEVAYEDLAASPVRDFALAPRAGRACLPSLQRGR